LSLQLFLAAKSMGGFSTIPLLINDPLRPIHTYNAAPCRSQAVPLPCSSLIYTCQAAPLPCIDSAVSFVKVRVVAGNLRTASPTV